MTGPGRLGGPAGAALASAADRLVGLQHPAGTWTDFLLAPGPADAWPTAVVAASLLDAAARLDPLRAADCRAAAERAAAWLVAHDRGRGVWGWNGDVPPDSDSTAQVVLLLCRLGLPVPPGAVAFLRGLRAEGGYRTYGPGHPSPCWTVPTPDVTAAVLLALDAAGALGAGELAAGRAALRAAQGPDGLWRGIWWPSPWYPTALALSALLPAAALELPAPVPAPDAWSSPAGPFERAWRLRAALLLGLPAGRAVAGLVRAQHPDGSWGDAGVLRVPPGEGDGPAVAATDARRTFTTAAVVAALSRVPGRQAAPAKAVRPRARERSAYGRELDALVRRCATAAGFPPAAADRAAATFAALTRESLAVPCAWPAPQLSTLAGGGPLEFSVPVGPRVPPGLRWTAEAGDPVAPPAERAAGGLRAVAEVAAARGSGPGWARLRPALDVLADPGLPVPDGTRFWVWAGLDETPDDRPATVKAYLNLFARELGGARGRLDDALAALCVPADPARHDVLAALDAAGFPHELGLAAAGDRAAAKVYYELPGWDAELLERILAITGIPCGSSDLRPRIPGLVAETASGRARAGIAFRVDLRTGAVRDVTTAAAFPDPLVPHAEARRRVRSWIAASGGTASAYHRLSGVLLQAWERGGAPGARMHSLFTRTAGDAGRHTTVYLRPPLRTGVAGP